MFLLSDLAEGLGFEPRIAGSEPDVLPLHYPSIWGP